MAYYVLRSKHATCLKLNQIKFEVIPNCPSPRGVCGRQRASRGGQDDTGGSDGGIVGGSDGGIAGGRNTKGTHRRLDLGP